MLQLPNFLRALGATAFANAAPVLLTAKETCHRLAISEPTLRRYSKTLPGFPRPVWIGPRRKAYRRDEVEDYMRTGFQPQNG